MINNETAKSTYTILENKYDYDIGFQYGFKPDNTPQIKVYLNKHSNTPLVYGVGQDYVLSEDGLKVVLSSITPGDRLDIIRDIPLTQLSNYHVGRIDPEQIENDFDLAVERDQELRGDIQFIGEVPLDHEARIQDLEQEVDDIEALIPNQTTTENQLADKSFVNSSIATSTATFRGTYDTLAELEEVTADENDYGFVVTVDAVGNTLYARYKYTTATDPASWVFEYYLNNSSFTADQWSAINSGVTPEIIAGMNATTGRNVGDIFLTMRTDNGLNGAVECNGGTYDTTNSTGAQTIAALLSDGKVPFVSLATYASTVAAKGWCDKIGWDGIGTTTFRVPTLTPHIVETNGLAIAGNGISLGLTDGTQELGLGYYASNSYYTGAAKNNSGQTVGSTFDGIGTTLSNKILGVSTDATKSGIVGDVSDEWQPRVMIQLMVSATDEAVATCTAVTAQVAANTSAIAGADYVVETQLPTVDNDYTWSRLYKSGWVEQGQYGHIQRTSAQTTINLPVEMADDKYTVLTAGTMATTYASLTTTSFVLTTTANQYAGWEVKGMSAQNS